MPVRRLKLILLRLARAAGLFALARRLTADKLRILAYHGGSVADEHEFKPGLFMTPATFRARLESLVRGGYPVLGLDEALARRQARTLPSRAVVITIDDGWYGTARDMFPALKAAGLPATLYVATYYLERQTQVFNVAAAYLLWRARDREIDLARLDPALSGVHDLRSPAVREEVEEALTARADALPDAKARQALLRSLARMLGIDLDVLERRRQFAFLDEEEGRDAARSGVDLQLHTHRHRFPAGDRCQAEAEIADNRLVLGRLVPGPRRHFCYPSGRYGTHQFAWLEGLDVASAVTTERGLNGPDRSPYELRRILDSEDLAPIEFEAELAGFAELLRGLRRSR